jgi:hypothetical protein
LKFGKIRRPEGTIEKQKGLEAEEKKIHTYPGVPDGIL